MKTVLDIHSYQMPIMIFIVMDMILLSTFLVIGIPAVFLSKEENIIDPVYGIKMPWHCGHERLIKCMHCYFYSCISLPGGPPHGKKYKSYIICNMEDYDRTFYWLADTLMTFQRYLKGVNVGPSVKLIPRFLPLELNLLFIEYMLIVRPM